MWVSSEGVHRPIFSSDYQNSYLRKDRPLTDFPRTPPGAGPVRPVGRLFPSTLHQQCYARRNNLLTISLTSEPLVAKAGQFVPEFARRSYRKNTSVSNVCNVGLRSGLNL